MIPRFLQFLRPVLPWLNTLSRVASTLSQLVMVTGLISICISLFAIPYWMPWLKFLMVLTLAIGILVGWRSLHSAFHDRLTGLPNRALFLRQLERAIQRTKQNRSSPFAVFLLDLDRFKAVNDSFGQKDGDQLLIAITQRLLSCLSPTASLARIGGNEFAILWKNVLNAAQAAQIADQLQGALTPVFNINGQEVYATTSTGIALSANYTWADDLLKDAQIATYRAKTLGRARHALFEPSMRVRTVPLAQLEADLRQALERQELRLHYQALVFLQTGKIAGFEALVRWQHPQQGLIFPAEFIPIAEDTGLIASIGRWALYEACCQAQNWQQQFPTEPPLLISVNLSGRQFSQPDLIDQVKQVLQETGLDARTLKLEITESLVMENIETAIATLQQIKALNIQLGIDDFGTGYSSLSHLYRLPIDTLKVDQSFVSRIGNDYENDEIVSAIVALAHRLGMNVIAEGIETTRQLALLRALNCEYGQGYFFSEPLQSEAAETLLRANPCWSGSG